jgi:hypothetical protein
VGKHVKGVVSQKTRRQLGLISASNTLPRGHAETKRTCRAVFCHPAPPIPAPPLPSPRSSRPRPPPPPEADPPPPRALPTQHNAAACLQPAASGSAQASVPCLSHASAGAPFRSQRSSVPHFQRGNCGKEKRWTRPAKRWRHAELCFGFWFLLNSPSTCVWAGLHLSSDVSLPAALRCELHEVDSKGQYIPGCFPTMATRRRANRSSLF